MVSKALSVARTLAFMTLITCTAALVKLSIALVYLRQRIWRTRRTPLMMRVVTAGSPPVVALPVGLV